VPKVQFLIFALKRTFALQNTLFLRVYLGGEMSKVATTSLLLLEGPSQDDTHKRVMFFKSLAINRKILFLLSRTTARINGTTGTETIGIHLKGV